MFQFSIFTFRIEKLNRSIGCNKIITDRPIYWKSYKRRGYNILQKFHASLAYISEPIYDATARHHYRPDFTLRFDVA